MQQQLQSLDLLYMERIQQLLMQWFLHCLLKNVVMVGQAPGASTSRSFYGTQDIFHISNRHLSHCAMRTASVAALFCFAFLLCVKSIVRYGIIEFPH
jgi:hypothetical protein